MRLVVPKVPVRVADVVHDEALLHVPVPPSHGIRLVVWRRRIRQLLLVVACCG
jgi:hypothetical protein